MVDVLLVSMPYGALLSPSLALSLLQPQIRRRGLSCDIRYFTLRFGNIIGRDLYSTIAAGRRDPANAFSGEWTFADAVTPRPRAAERAYVREVLRASGVNPDVPWMSPATRTRVAALLRVKRRVPGFLAACEKDIRRAAPRIVGFTSIFQQHLASLALAKRIKTALPDTVIVFGGANCESVMGAETLRQYPFVDAIVSGEGDIAFPEMAKRIIDGAVWSDLPGVLSQAGVKRAFAFGRFPSTPVVTDLDALPYPDYSDYFAQFTQSRSADSWEPAIYIETSRGCWWGERMHCTFCGLNGGTMAFRSKSPDRALAEFRALGKAHPGANVQVVDNILDLSYFNTLLPALAKRRTKLQLFYETKSNLKKQQVALLADAGITNIQPGIESFSDVVLKLMKKGVSGLQNVQLLKWCKQYGVEPYWNVLFGFPGEPPAEYTRMAELVPALVHLPAPKGFGPIRVDRFSPNFFDADRMGLANLQPMPAYRFLHAVPDAALHNLAYHFSHDYKQATDVWSYVGAMVAALQEWRALGRECELLSVDDGSVLTLVDTRPAAPVPLTVLSAADREIYLACDAIADIDTILKRVALDGQSGSRDALANRLARMVDRRIMIADAQRYLALAVPVTDYQPSGTAASRLVTVLATVSIDRNRLRIPLDRPEFQLGSATIGRFPPVRAARGPRGRGLRMVRSDFRIVGNELRVRCRRP